MYKKDFDVLLSKHIPRATFLYGECDFFIYFYADKIKEKIKNHSQVDIFSFYFEEYNVQMIKEILAEQSLFSSSSLVILKLYKIKDSKKKAKDTDIASFLEILKQNQHSYLIIEFYNNDSADYTKVAKNMSALFNSTEFVFVRFFNPLQKEALEILKQRANELNLKINDATLAHLYEMQNKDLGICVNELDKFKVIKGEITKETINKLSYGLHTHSIEELCEAMLERKDHLSIIAKLEEEGVQDMEIIRALQAYFYRLFLFFSYITQNGRVNCVEILGYALPSQLIDKYSAYAMRLGIPKYLAIFKVLNTWRVDVMRGKEKNYLSCLIKLQAIISYNGRL